MVSEKSMARDVAIGDVVEFETGTPVRVVDIEPNWSDEPDPHPSLLASHGRSIVFGAVLASEPEYVTDAQTIYVRRERSPLLGSRVVR